MYPSLTAKSTLGQRLIVISLQGFVGFLPRYRAFGCSKAKTQLASWEHANKAGKTIELFNSKEGYLIILRDLPTADDSVSVSRFPRSNAADRRWLLLAAAIA